MKIPNHSRSKGHGAFTLVELLVVIAVIAVLAGMLFAVTGNMGAKRVIAVGTAELVNLSAAIEAYKARKNFYPPDNPGSPQNSPLYFELVGTVFTNNGGGPYDRYVTLDGSTVITTNQMPADLGVGGFINSSTSARGTDENPGPETFLKEVKQDQLRTNGTARVLVCSEGNGRWNYNCSTPTNNPGSFDLWVDIRLKGKTYRINNWSKAPQVF